MIPWMRKKWSGLLHECPTPEGLVLLQLQILVDIDLSNKEYGNQIEQSVSFKNEIKSSVLEACRRIPS